MKTTVELPDGLLDEAKELAAEQKTTLKELIVTGLRHVLRDRQERLPFHLKNASFKGCGLQPEFRGASWRDIREATYDKRGG